MKKIRLPVVHVFFAGMLLFTIMGFLALGYMLYQVSAAADEVVAMHNLCERKLWNATHPNSTTFANNALQELIKKGGYNATTLSIE